MPTSPRVTGMIFGKGDEVVAKLKGPRGVVRVRGEVVQAYPAHHEYRVALSDMTTRKIHQDHLEAVSS